VAKVREAAGKTGDLYRLSEADMGVLALSLECGAEIVSDDYGVQNVASSMGLKYHTTAKEGIKREYIWEKVCPGCGLKHSSEFKVCGVCGTKLKSVGRESVRG